MEDSTYTGTHIGLYTDGSGRVCPTWIPVSRHSCRAHLDRHPRGWGLSLQALTLLLGARFIVWRLKRPFLGEYRRGPRHFCNCRACLGYDTAPESTKNKALCHTRSVSGTYDKYRFSRHYLSNTT